MYSPRFLPCGDTALVVEFGNTIDPVLNRKVRRFSQRLASAHIPGVLEIVPTYRSVLVYYDNLLLDWASVVSELSAVAESSEETRTKPERVVSLPVLYGGNMGPDLEKVACHTGLSCEEVIDKHCAPEYLVYMIGFTPGFPYLGGLDPVLATPRLKRPRLRTPQGSVGIGGSQTGVYSIPAPGGFNVIGRTPVRLFDPERAQPFLLEAGDLVRFEPVNQKQYDDIENGQRSLEQQNA